jgi:peptide/nickel transport system substrate-binding protein
LIVTLASGLVVHACAWEVPPPSKLTVVLSAAPTGRDPLATFDEVSDLIFGNVFQPVLVDPAATVEGVGVVESWSNPDPLTWVLYVRQGVRFHNGDPVRAEDVARTISAVLADESCPFRSFLTGIASAEAESPHRIRVCTSQPMNLVLHLGLLPVVPDGRRYDGTHLPIGSGPFRVLSWTDGQRVVLERVAGGFPRLVEIVVAEDTVLRHELLATARPVLGLVHGGDIRRQVEQLGLRTLLMTGHSTSYVVCNVRPDRATAALDVRRAIAASIDREALAESIHRSPDLAEDVFPAGVVGYRQGRYRPASDWLEPGVVPATPLRLVAVESVGDVAEAVAAMLESAGFVIDVELVPIEAGLAALSAGEFDLSILGYMCTSGHGLELIEFAFPAVPAHGRGWNFSGYESERLQALVEELRGTTEIPSQRQVLATMSDILLEDLPWLPLLDVHREAVVSPDIEWAPPWHGRVHFDEVRLR